MNWPWQKAAHTEHTDRKELGVIHRQIKYLLKQERVRTEVQWDFERRLAALEKRAYATER